MATWGEKNEKRTEIFFFFHYSNRFIKINRDSLLLFGGRFDECQRQTNKRRENKVDVRSGSKPLKFCVFGPS